MQCGGDAEEMERGGAAADAPAASALHRLLSRSVAALWCAPRSSVVRVVTMFSHCTGFKAP